jgi:DNA-directed RNA polymerase specialized sigma24 family protein
MPKSTTLDRNTRRWLSALAAKVIADHISSRGPTTSGHGIATLGAATTERRWSDRLEASWRVAALVVDRLAPLQREVLELRLRDQLRYVEIAARLEVPMGTVHSRLARGQQRVRVLTAEASMHDGDRAATPVPHAWVTGPAPVEPEDGSEAPSRSHIWAHLRR